MSKFSYKSLLIIFFFLLISVVVLAKFILPKNKVSAAWWNDGWNYRQAINISTHTTAQSNVYITTSINIGTTAKTQTDDGDFRFVNQNGELLSYYLVSGVGTTNITFHIQFSNFPAGSQTIYAYYGNFSVENGFSLSDFTTLASNYTIGSLSSEETGGGPIAYWKFDEGIGTTIYDSSSNQNNGLLSGTTLPVWIDESQCISGKCLGFSNSSDTINFGHNITIDSLTKMTLTAWVKANTWTHVSTILNKGPESAVDHFWWGWGTPGWGPTGGGMSLEIGDSSGYQVLKGQDNLTWETNHWYFIAVTIDNSTKQYKHYRDGILAGSGTFSKNFSPGTLNLYADSYLGNSGHNLNGYLDEIRIYSYVRTASQIKLDYNARGSLQGSSVNLGIKSSTRPNLSSKLVAYYKFNEGSGTTIYNGSIGSSLNGTLGTGSSAPAWTNNGKFNKALIFNGTTSKIDLPNDIVSVSNIRTNGITYSAWIKTSNNSQIQRIVGQQISNGYSDYSSGGLGINSSGKAQMISYDDSGSYKYMESTTTLQNNIWYHIVGTYNSSDQKMRIYINGELEGNPISIVTFSRLFTNASNRIGLKDYVTPYSFVGSIDEVKIYNTALTDDEVKQDYNQGSAISFGSSNQTIGGTTTSLDYCIPGDTSYCASPVAEYNFEENTGTTTKDISGNNNNFTFNTGTSAPTWSIGKKSIGSALNFDGSSNWVQRTLSPSIAAATDYTQCLWFNSSTNTTRQVIIDDANQWEHWIAITTNKTIMGCYYNTTQICTTSTATINLNTWNHVCLSVKSGQKMSLYLNGSLTSENTNIGSSLPKIYDDICIGANGGSVHGEKFTGKIDDVKIYNYARTPAQVAYDYNKGAPIGWWKLDECQGSIANDSSGTGNTGSINIGPSGTQTSTGTCTTSGTAWGNGASGHTNSSLNFDGYDDNVSLNTAFNGTNNYSLSSWVYLNSNFSSSKYDRFLGTPTWGSGRIGLIVTPNYKLGANTYFGAGGDYWQTTNITVPLNQWFHAAITFDRNGNQNLFYNGILVSSINISAASSYSWSGENLKIAYGTYGDTYYVPHEGKIDDVRIYNYALTVEQVKQLYNGGSVNFN